MTSNFIFQKTQAGRSEIGTNQLGLTQHQRRILILVNGNNDSAALSKMSLCKDADEILEFLLSKSLVEIVEATLAEAAAPPKISQPAVVQTQASTEE